MGRKDITVVMCCPKCPGTEVREEYKRGFGVPTLIAVHRENDPKGEGMAIAKALASGTGGDRAGVLESSPIAEVKSARKRDRGKTPKLEKCNRERFYRRHLRR